MSPECRTSGGLSIQPLAMLPFAPSNRVAREARAAYSFPVSKKNEHIADLTRDCHGQGLEPHYLGFFVCFNQGRYFEAHEVLEHLWLVDRDGPNYSFYKGLIQLAGAFVHLQKNRPGPAASLFKLSRANLEKYPASHEQLDVSKVLQLIASWLNKLAAGKPSLNFLTPDTAPRLTLPGKF